MIRNHMCHLRHEAADEVYCAEQWKVSCQAVMTKNTWTSNGSRGVWRADCLLTRDLRLVVGKCSVREVRFICLCFSGQHNSDLSKLAINLPRPTSSWSVSPPLIPASMNMRRLDLIWGLGVGFVFNLLCLSYEAIGWLLCFVYMEWLVLFCCVYLESTIMFV